MLCSQQKVYHMIITKHEIRPITLEDVQLLQEAYEAQQRRRYAEQWSEIDRFDKAYLHKLNAEFERNAWFVRPQPGDTFEINQPGGGHPSPPQIQDAIDAFAAYKGVCRYCKERILFDTSYIAARSALDWGIVNCCYSCNEFRLSQ